MLGSSRSSPTGQLPASTVNFSAATFAAGGSVTSRANLPLQAGYFNNEPALYITPEVGVGAGSSAATALSIAQGFNANYVPTAFNTLNDHNSAVDDIYVFTNFTQGNVLASSPQPAGYQNTDPNYTPIWQINLVTWNSGYRPRALTSQQDVLNAQKNNEVTVTLAPIIVECSVIVYSTRRIAARSRDHRQRLWRAPGRSRVYRWVSVSPRDVRQVAAQQRAGAAQAGHHRS